MKQKGFLVVLVFIVLVFAGYFGYKYFNPIPSPSPSPTSTLTTSAVPTAEAIITSVGTVSGKLCYPSSFLPPGEIVAKELDSGKTYTQTYEGTFNGGGLTYSFELPVGTYHIRYQAHASTKDTSIFTSGYYDECAKTMHTNECTPDSGHINIPVTIKVGEEITNVDLCDFYYNPTQEQTLNKSF
ncbi:hypothetical protein A2594_01830 [Candidatus Woesebacteria bacterium RIFOXYD1_FULL_41_28]|uniref:Uncharacterized protein n=3 Tax=Candidatus Woeseibacteriota TaxID=1752722 RepID=A0A1F8DHU6_9BACT|nr:MAG: hypothetical protein A2393_01565 [Candidatus Woesebacteria bacterium RIFOXYB1_FULL_41_13]OGM87609.1 MAG: hypothetical protein A2594_01830 [Candidatus Woesebacteria bacterium RIFOXYD1_FULL_41_28]